MSDKASQTTIVQKRLVRALPAAGASRRVRRQPASGDDKPAGSSEIDKAANEDGVATPKATATPLPAGDEVSTPKVPIITLNEASLPNTSQKTTSSVIDEAKEAELRKKFLEMRLQDPPKAVVPTLRIPRKTVKPPKPVQRRMARVKPTVKTAPRPEITFGKTVTVFGDVESEATEKSEVEEKESSEKVDGESKPETPNQLPMRKHRTKKERQKIRLAPPPPPDPSEALTEGKRKPISLERSESETKEDQEKKKMEAKAQFMKLASLLAKDIYDKRIPKSQLKMLTRGKSAEEAAVMTKIIDKAMKLAERLREKEKQKGKGRAAVRTVEEGSDVDKEGKGHPNIDAAKESNTDENDSPKGKEGAAGVPEIGGGSATPTTT